MQQSWITADPPWTLKRRKPRSPTSGVSAASHDLTARARPGWPGLPREVMMGRLTRTAKTAALVAGSLGVAALMTIFTLVVPATAAPIAVATSIPKCTAGDLGVWLAIDQSDGAAGTIYTPLEFTNLSHHTCRLHGFPGVSAISSGGQQIGVPAGWDHAVKATTVRLAPGRTAHAILEYHDVIIA